MTSCSLGDAMVIGMGQEMPFKYVVDQLVSGFVGFFLPDSYFFKENLHFTYGFFYQLVSGFSGSFSRTIS